MIDEGGEIQPQDAEGPELEVSSLDHPEKVTQYATTDAYVQRAQAQSNRWKRILLRSGAVVAAILGTGTIAANTPGLPAFLQDITHTGQTTESGNPVLKPTFTQAELDKAYDLRTIQNAHDTNHGTSRLIFAHPKGFVEGNRPSPYTLFVTQDGKNYIKVEENVTAASWYQPDGDTVYQGVDPIFAVQYDMMVSHQPQPHVALFKFMDGGVKNVAEMACAQPFDLTTPDGGSQVNYRWNTFGNQVLFSVMESTQSGDRTVTSAAALLSTSLPQPK